MANEINWTALWTDPKYLALHARKDRIETSIQAWRPLAIGTGASPHAVATLAKLEAAHGRACKRICKYEDASAK